MKKILFLAMAAAAMVGCSQNEEIENAGQKAEIEFQTVVKAGTKAAIITTGNIDAFTVNAYKTTEDMTGTVTLTSANALKEKLAVKKTGETTWGYDGTIYWPAKDKVQFFGTSPVEALTLPAPGYPTFDYTVGTIDTQKDLIAAYAANKTKADATVKFAFSHLLTQVNFSIKGDLAGCVYNVKKLELVGVKDKATFTFDNTASVGTWGNWAATTGTYVWEDATGITLTATDLTTTTPIISKAGEALFMLMPQALSGASLKITYSALPDGASEATFDGEKTIALTETWAKGQNIHYTLKLTSDATALAFGTPEVGGWTNNPTDKDTPAGN